MNPLLGTDDFLSGGSFFAWRRPHPCFGRAAGDVRPRPPLPPAARHGRGRALQVGGEAEHGLQPDTEHHHRNIVQRA